MGRGVRRFPTARFKVRKSGVGGVCFDPRQLLGLEVAPATGNNGYDSRTFDFMLGSRNRNGRRLPESGRKGLSP
jgi:hypothetical protein